MDIQNIPDIKKLVRCPERQTKEAKTRDFCAISYDVGDLNLLSKFHRNGCKTRCKSQTEKATLHCKFTQISSHIRQFIRMCELSDLVW